MDQEGVEEEGELLEGAGAGLPEGVAGLAKGEVEGAEKKGAGEVGLLEEAEEKERGA